MLTAWQTYTHRHPSGAGVAAAHLRSLFLPSSNVAAGSFVHRNNINYNMLLTRQQSRPSMTYIFMSSDI